MKKEHFIILGLGMMNAFLSFYLLYRFSNKLVDPLMVPLFLGLAFILPLIFSAWTSSIKADKSFMTGGSGLIVLACLMPEKYSALIISGLGLALFNPGALDLLDMKNDKPYPLGLLVGLEAIGLGLGLRFSYSWLFWSMLSVSCVLTALNIFGRYEEGYEKEEQEFQEEQEGENKVTIFAIGAIIVSALCLSFSREYASYTFLTTVNGTLYGYLAIGLGFIISTLLSEGLQDAIVIFSAFVLSLVCCFFQDQSYTCLLCYFAFGLGGGVMLDLMRKTKQGERSMELTGIISALVFSSFLTDYIKNANSSLYYLTPIFISLSFVLLSAVFILLKKGGKIKPLEIREENKKPEGINK
jgi:hypothetical protein